MLRRALLVFLILWLPLQGMAASLPICAHALMAQGDAIADDLPPCHTAAQSSESSAGSVTDAVCDDCEACHAICVSALPIDQTVMHVKRENLFRTAPPLAWRAHHVAPLLHPPTS